jgi:deazaflavin-dependent oxidoreductase (nitroreductase family)
VGRLLTELEDLDFCYVTTTGRRTGSPHTIEIWFVLQEGVVYMLSGDGEGSDWVRNLREHPTVGLRLGERDLLAQARVVVDPAEDELARRLVFEKYSPQSEDDLQEWRRTALPVAIDLPAAGPA